MPKTKILIADDHRVVIEGIKSALQEHPEFKVAGEAVDGLEAVEFAKSLEPNIVIMDISMPNLSGIEATRQIKGLNPGIQILIYTMHSDKEFVIDLFKAGISAYVLKDDPLSDLILALKAVEGGGTYFSTMAPTLLARHMEEMEEKSTSKNSFDTLSQREVEVFQLLAEGKRIKEIAKQLFISPKTVESHKYNIMEKLQAASVIDLTKIAIRKNLIKV
ncbi:MAG: response regulator [Desulfobacterales bacterium]|jgi:DNA-binding NarL/FixJ family response regulator|nr:response regulator [Desulfobacterales bacterium]MCD4786680.1 response regulator transcription factor [Desulfobacterales bacterium]